MATVSPTQAFRTLTAAAALATWALVAVGGVVRVSESGLGCPDWPLCDGRLVPGTQKEPIIEYAHRATAAVAIVLLVVAAVWALRRYRSRLDLVLPLVLSVALVPVQALLGATVVWLELPDHLVGVHFMIGMTMLGLAVLAAVAARRDESRATACSRSYARVAVALGASALVLVSLGASVVATDAMHACGEEWPACNGGVANGGELAALQVAHRTAGYVVAALALALLVLAVRGRGPRLAGAAPFAFVAAQIGFGVGMVVSGHDSMLHDVLRMLHVAGSAAVWASVVAVVGLVLAEPAAAQAADVRVPAGAVARRAAS